MKRKNHVKQVRETAAGKSISAYIVLDKKGRLVATVHVYHTFDNKGFRKWVDIFQPHSKDLGFAQYTGQTLDSALNGAIIDGVQLYSQASMDPASQKLLEQYTKAKDNIARMKLFEKAIKLGMEWCGFDGEKCMSLYYVGGLERLEKLGYRVIHAF